MAKTYNFRTETYNKPSNPSKANEKFESDDEELYPVEYLDKLNDCLVKLNPFLEDDFQSEYLKGYFQGDKLLLTIANKLGHIKKEWLIEKLRTQLHTLDPSDPWDRNDGKKLKDKKGWFVVSEEAFKNGGTHFHVFICLSERKRKTLGQLQSILKLENELVTATPFIRAVKGKNWDSALRYVLKEDRTPFCSLGSARLLTYLNNLDSGSLKENDKIKKLIKAIINESEFLKPEDIKSKENLRSEVSDVSEISEMSDIDSSMKVGRVGKEDKIQIKKLETETVFLNSLMPGSYHFNSSNPIKIKYLVNLIKNHYACNYIARLSPFLTPTRKSMENVLSKLTKNPIVIISGFPHTPENRQLMLSLLTEINLYFDNDNKELENSLVFLCDDGGRFKLEIVNKMGDFITFIDENFNLISKKDLMGPDIQINLNSGDVNNNYYGLEKKEFSNLKKEIREELRQELIVEVTHLTAKMTNEMTAKIKEEVTAKITNELKMNLFAEVKEELKEELKAELMKNLSPQR